MSTALLEQISRLTEAQDWESTVNLTNEILAIEGPAADRAMGLYRLGLAHWRLGRNPFDYTQAIGYLRQAAKIDDLDGKVVRNLGSMLVTIGRFAEGRHVLQEWIHFFRLWSADEQGNLPGVQYTTGYAFRYEGRPAHAVLWYEQALKGFRDAGKIEWITKTSCALVQALVKIKRVTEARQLLDTIPVGSSCEAYRLKAATEVLAAEGNIDSALAMGELASEHLVEMDDPDPWELAELHALLALLQFQAGHTADRDMHLDLAMDCLRASQRHDLYRMVSLLLDHKREEVV